MEKFKSLFSAAWRTTKWVAMSVVAKGIMVACNPTEMPNPGNGNGNGGGDNGQPPVLTVDTIRTNANNITQMQTWLNALPAVQNPQETFHKLNITGNIKIDADDGAPMMSQSYTLRDVADARGRSDVQITGLWGGPYHIAGQKPTKIVPLIWNKWGQVPLGGYKFYTLYVYWPQFGQFSRIINIIDMPHPRVPRISSDDLISKHAQGITVVPDTVYFTQVLYNLVDLFKAMPPRPGQYVLITNDQSIINITEEQLRRFDQPILREAGISFSEADIYVLGNLIFYRAQTYHLYEHLIWRALAVRRAFLKQPDTFNRPDRPPWGRPSIVANSPGGQVRLSQPSKSQHNVGGVQRTAIALSTFMFREVMNVGLGTAGFTMPGSGFSVVIPDDKAHNITSTNAVFRQTAINGLRFTLMSVSGVNITGTLHYDGRTAILSTMTDTQAKNAEITPLKIPLEYHIIRFHEDFPGPRR